jgi:hypothetical protein
MELDPSGILSWGQDLGEISPATGEAEAVSVPPSPRRFVSAEILSVEDAVQWGDEWIVLDRRLGRIHFIDPGSERVSSLSREGPGPGELQDPVSLAVEDSALWVLNRRGLQLDRHSLGEGPSDVHFLSRRTLSGGGCLAGLTKALEILPGFGLAVLRICPGALSGPGTAWIESVGEDGKLTPVLSLPLGTPGSRRLHLLRQPVLTATADHFFMGTWDAPCVAVFDGLGALSEHRCLPEYDRPPTPAEERSGLERRLGWVSDLGFLPMEIPSHLPWYDRVFATSRGLVFRRVRAESARDLVLVGPDGQMASTNRWFPENTFVGEREILVAEDLPEGTSLTFFPNPWG